MAAVPYFVGKRQPWDQAILEGWLKNLIKEVESEEDVDGECTDKIDAAEEDKGNDFRGLLLPVKDLKDLIENDPEINMFFHQMFSQVPSKPPYNKDPKSLSQVRNYHIMLLLINRIITKAPEFNLSKLGMLPINAILNWSMGTTGGYAAFLNDKVNVHFKKILNYWALFLKSSDSCYVLSDDPETGWFGEDAMRAMPDFVKEFKCDPDKPHYGYTSWDDFFTREFRHNQRPIASPDDNTVIVNACESAPFDIQSNVQRRARFWIKSQPYSINFMLANDPLAEQFVHGTVYQAFLSPLNYHRWHSPVDGTIKKADIIDGSYYSEAQSEGFNDVGQICSQGYLTEVATRALIFIEADNPYIGLMCFMAVGMGDVSTCEITAYEGQRVKKGQQTGMFHFGGSSHCLIFRPGVEVEFHLNGQTPSLHSNNIPINSKIATVPCN